MKRGGDWIYWKSLKGALRRRIAERGCRVDVSDRELPTQLRSFPHDLIALVEPGEDIDPYIHTHDQVQPETDL